MVLLEAEGVGADNIQKVREALTKEAAPAAARR